MFYFVKRLSALRIVTEPCANRILLFGCFPVFLHDAFDVGSFGRGKERLVLLRAEMDNRLDCPFENLARVKQEVGKGIQKFAADCQCTFQKADGLVFLRRGLAYCLADMLLLIGLLFLKLPFVGDNLYEIVNFIKEKPLQIPDGVDERIAKLVRQMLTIDPAKRIGVRALLENELIATADDLAVDMPEVAKPQIAEGKLVQLKAMVCPPGYSFACVAMSIQRRLSFINAPYSPERLHPATPPGPTLTRTKPPVEASSSSSGEEIDEDGGNVGTRQI